MVDEEVKEKVEGVESKRQIDSMKLIKDFTDGLFRKFIATLVLYFLLSFLLKIGYAAFAKNKMDILLMVMTLAISTVTSLIAFYFATSQGSVDKSKQISKVLNGEEEEE